MDVDKVQGALTAFMSLVVAFQGIALWTLAKRLRMHTEKRHHGERD